MIVKLNELLKASSQNLLCTYVKRAKMATTLATRSKETSSDCNTEHIAWPDARAKRRGRAHHIKPLM